MPRSKFVFGLVVGTVLAGAALAGDGGAKPAAGNVNADQAFERLKKLAGDWQYVTPPDAASKGQTVLSYRVIGGGSAVVETIFPGGDMEMATVYHRDGDQLVLTHYCCCGNQPRMRATGTGDKDEIAFELTGGANLNPEKDMHMHSFRLRFVDADHLHSECQIFAKGKLADKHALDLVRKK
jgi:hypothetical protein